MGDLVTRVSAGVAGVMVAFVALIGAGVVLFGVAVSAHAPDAYIADGDPCCAHPDTWGEVADGVAWTLGFAAVDALIVTLAGTLFFHAATGRWPRLRRLALVPAGLLTVVAVAIAAAIVPEIDEARLRTDCDRFVFIRAAWRSSSDDETRRASAAGLRECGLLDGRTPTELLALLGSPDTSRETDGQVFWSYTQLTLVFEGRQLVDAF